ncbi:MAG: Mg2 transporter protein CorA family protein [Candidatus Kaiserbacteria bacterium GW2011_GWA2_49_19]|uniref:Mg2 transporter protein CorA family protein n=1 Tax=Candidatus Kaiserbacteria bacterium GW2011_GWA2_49_19 TaxID=1618669 RepID=A0A0G1YPF9_9BACT|nr:MAG: Mg2 transporter protein CorA family protein [Candidatus Kaiserbacteria bacterium GW2011_GWA2_49_19]
MLRARQRKSWKSWLGVFIFRQLIWRRARPLFNARKLSGAPESLQSFFAACAGEETKRELYFTGTAAHILFELLDAMLEAVFPILLHVNEDISAVDKKLFARSAERHSAEEILRLKTNVVTFRRAMQGHRTVLERLVMYGDSSLNLYSYQSYINTLREAVGEIWHMLDSQKESINALHETNESILSSRMNEVMKTLTIISVITFPLTLLATLFSIRANSTPFVDNRFGFWIILWLIVLLAALMLLDGYKPMKYSFPKPYPEVII